MTQPSRIFFLAVFVAAVLLLPGGAAAQNSVTPTVMPTPPGQLIVVNNGPGDQDDPHVSADLVSYSNSDGTNFTLRYFDLASKADNQVPNSGPPAAGGTYDFLADVRGSVIALTRVSNTASAIFTFDTASPGTPPVEIAPQPGSNRQAAQIGDQTIVWQDFGFTYGASDIVAYDRQTGTTTRLTSDSMVNQLPAISPDGRVIVWGKCANISAPCSTWKAVLSNGTWTAQQLVSPAGGDQQRPDTDGNIIVYGSANGVYPAAVSQIFWQSVNGGTEQGLDLQGGQGGWPSVSGGPGNSLIAFAYLPAGAGFHDLAVYNPASNVLYDITKDVMPGDTSDKQLSDISVTPDGKVRVVWQQQDADLNVYAYTFNLPPGDFTFGPISPLTIAAGGSGSATVTVNPVNGFGSAVSLSVSGQPAGVTASLSADPVTPSGGNPATSVLDVSVASFLAPTSFTLTVTGASGSLSHATTAAVTVTATTASVGNSIGDLVNAGCIDNAGVGAALTSKLSAAQSAAAAGNVQTAINTLMALKNQINAQAGKHIATACTIGGVAFNPVTVLLLDVQGLIDSLRVGTVADPVTGYVVNVSGAGVPGATVSVTDAAGNLVASATSDITGFYYMATTGVLTPGASYTLAVTGLPSGFASAAPASQPFTWQGTAVAFANFVLN